MNRPVGVLRFAGATVLLAFLCGAKAPSAPNTPVRRPTETKILAEFEDPALCISEVLPKPRRATTCGGSGIPAVSEQELRRGGREMLSESDQGRVIEAIEECLGAVARLAFYATNPGTYRCQEISRSEKLVEFRAGTQSKSLCLTIATQRPQPKP